MKNLFTKFVCTFFIFASVPTLATDEMEATDFVIESAGQKAEIHIRHPEHKIDVRIINRQTHNLPNAIGVTLRDKNGKEKEYELNAVNPFTRDTAVYQGQLPANPESYVGAMIRIPFTKVKKSIPNIRPYPKKD